MPYQQLLNHFDQILKSLPQQFDSHEFVNALKAKYPADYHQALKQYQNHAERTLHARIAKDLKRLGKAKHIGDVSSITVFGKRSKNALWEKHNCS